jgi:hypothetical protein
MANIFSPSSQEMTGQARFVGSNSIGHRPPAIIHPSNNHNHHHSLGTNKKQKVLQQQHKPKRKN